MSPSCQPCRNVCRSVFDRVHVSHVIRSGARVYWDLLPTFIDPLPYVFQLQVGRTGNPDAGDWLDVGLPVENTFYAIDDQQRVYGQARAMFYRVVLTTPNGTYYSEPTGMWGMLDHRDWRIAREIVRKEKLRHRLNTIEGYLLKRRITGPKCTQCLDFQLDDSKNPQCPECYGTGYQCGYYYPMPCVWADLSPSTRQTGTQLASGRGVVTDVIVKARMLQIPLLEELDVWVCKDSDDRYFIHNIQSVAEMRGVPLIANVEMRPAAFSDSIYSVPIPDQLQANLGA